MQTVAEARPGICTACQLFTTFTYWQERRGNDVWAPLWLRQVKGKRGGERKMFQVEKQRNKLESEPWSSFPSFPLPSGVCLVCFPISIFYFLLTFHILLHTFKNLPPRPNGFLPEKYICWGHPGKFLREEHVLQAQKDGCPSSLLSFVFLHTWPLPSHLLPTCISWEQGLLHAL